MRACPQRSTGSRTLPTAASVHTPITRRPTVDYAARLAKRPAQQSPGTAPQCPLLLLAPMENLADSHFRRAHASTIGGMDEACTEFMRVPSTSERPRATVRGVTSWYNASELADYGVPLAAQIMGAEPELLALAAKHLAEIKHAPRIDLNCGCPANTVTGRGAGSSLLRSPELLHRCAKAMVDAAQHCPETIVTVKMRTGFDDTSLFFENLAAVQEAGVAFVTIHGRTKQQSYEGQADWGLIAQAAAHLDIPVIGNGDVVCSISARQLQQATGCRGIMIGRGSVQDPLLFHRIKATYQVPDLPWQWDEPEVVQAFLRQYALHAFQSEPTHEPQQPEDHAATAAHSFRQAISTRGKMGIIKKVSKYLFTSSSELSQAVGSLLRVVPADMTAEELVEQVCKQLAKHWPSTGPTRHALINHMYKTEVVVLRSSCADVSASQTRLVTTEVA